MTFTASSWAQITLSGSQSPDTIIPDADLSGLAETINLGSGIQSITDVTLSLDVGGTANYSPFNGDYYAYLTDGSTTVVLLNRVGTAPGTTVLDTFGYSDKGFDVQLSDGSPNIHNYQSGPYTLNGAGQLTGTWGPDGGSLSAFNGLSSAGNWTLFIADESPGGIGNLDSWTLDVTGTPSTVVSGVPDSSSTMGLLALGASSLAVLSLRHRRLAAVR
jgi:hypothetical protein